MNKISLLNASDLPQALVIEKRCQQFCWSKNIFISSQGEGYLNYRIDVGNRMVGFAITRLVLDEATLFNIAIDPDYQRCGFARQLLMHVIQELEQRAIATLWLEVRASNQAARILYQGLGFNEVTIRQAYYPAQNGHEDAVVMALPLRLCDGLSVAITTRIP